MVIRALNKGKSFKTAGEKYFAFWVCGTPSDLVGVWYDGGECRMARDA
jgi:hypothetical protein